MHLFALGIDEIDGQNVVAREPKGSREIPVAAAEQVPRYADGRAAAAWKCEAPRCNGLIQLSKGRARADGRGPIRPTVTTGGAGPSLFCAKHDRQVGGESPRSSLMAAKVILRAKSSLIPHMYKNGSGIAQLRPVTEQRGCVHSA